MTKSINVRNNTKIIIFGNCQGGQIARLLSQLLPPERFSVNFLSNNTRTGQLRTNEEILFTIGGCDLLIYQPLGDHHGLLGDENIRQVSQSNCLHISFPYIFNSGAFSLCHAPMIPKHRYGFIFGEEIIVALLNKGRNKEELSYAYEKGIIDFRLIERFDKCMNELKKRESSTDIKISDYILKNYKKERLFITHNHPSNLVLNKIIEQIAQIASLPITVSQIAKLNVPDLKETNCPVTPHEIKVLGYQFGKHHEWLIKGQALLDMIIDNYNIEHGREG